MLRKFLKLMAIPEPHRSGMVRRTLYSYFPKYEKWRSRQCEVALQRRIARANGKFVGADGPRYLGNVAHRSAGIGHALSEWNTGLLLARELGLTFAHSSFNPQWERFLGLGDGFVALEELFRQKDLEVVWLPAVDWKNADGATVLRAHTQEIRAPHPLLFMLFDGQNSFRQHTTSEEIRKLYWRNNRSKLVPFTLKDNQINVALHIRRRNSMDLKNPAVCDTQSAAYRARYIDLEYFAQIMDAISAALGPKNIVFNVYSQGLPADFQMLEKHGKVQMHLEADEFVAFHNLAAADVLVTSPSSFSFKAGMLCPGLKIARYPWWHHIPEDEEWYRVGEQPALEHDRLVAFMQKHWAKVVDRQRLLGGISA